MDKESYSWGGIGFLALFFLIIFAFLNRGSNGFGWGATNGCAPHVGDGIGLGASSFGFQNFRATCDSEKQEMLNNANTQYMVERQAALTREAVNASANLTQTKIDYYGYQDLRDKLNETQRALMEANNKLFVKDQLAPITAALSTIQCQMLTKPQVTGVGAVCPNSAIINGLGVNSLNSCCSCV